MNTYLPHGPGGLVPATTAQVFRGHLVLVLHYLVPAGPAWHEPLYLGRVEVPEACREGLEA